MTPRTACRGLRATLLPLLLIAGCSPVPGPDARGAAPPRGVILISIDTLAANHLGAYGYQLGTSPFFDTLAERGVLFENAFAQYPSTLVSHISMFTGLYPREHGVYPPAKALSTEIEMLPERFAAHGFRTAGFTEGGFVARNFGFHRGFQEFADPRIERDTDIERTFARGIEYLRRVGPEDRFLLFLHSYSVHDPYEPPEPYRRMFWHGEPPAIFESTGRNLTEVNEGVRTIAPEGLAYFRAMYDASVRYVDDVLEGLFRELESLGLLEDSLVVITSDHGEAFLEHGAMGHSQVYPETLRVPLLILLPDGETGRVRSPVGLVDLPPTLYEMAGIPIPEGLSGESRAELLRHPRSAATGQTYGEVVAGELQQTLVVNDEQGDTYQLVASSLPAETDGTWVARRAAFDVPADRLSVEAVSFAEPRVLEVRVDGEPRPSILLDTDWQPVVLELSAPPARHRVVLTAPSCASPLSLEISSDSRCLAFKVRGLPLRRLELFNLDSDPLARNDLSRQRPELLRRLAARLQGLTWTTRAEPQSRELEGETLDALRALGYVD